MPQTEAEKKESEARQAKLQKAQQVFMAAGLRAMFNSLPKTKKDTGNGSPIT